MSRGHTDTFQIRRTDRAGNVGFVREQEHPDLSRRPSSPREPGGRFAPEPLLYSAGLAGSPMIEPGRLGAYFAVFSQVGLTLAIPMLIGAFGGNELDKLFNSHPILVIIGLFGGMGLGGYGCYRVVTTFLKRVDGD